MDFHAPASTPTHLKGQGPFEAAQRVALLVPRVAARVRVDVHGSEVDRLPTFGCTHVCVSAHQYPH